MKKLAVFMLTIALAGCGGGGGGGGGSSGPAGGAPTPTTFTASAMAGELLQYTVDTAARNYSYTITDSAFGLNGRSGSGTLTANSDGTYSLSGIPNARIAILPNGLLLAAMRETINGVLTTVPVVGIQSPVTSFAAAASTYNYIQRSCLLGTCGSGFGTLVISGTGTWTSCPSGNIVPACPGATNSGTLNALGGGLFQVISGGFNIGTALVFTASGQNVLVLDLKDTRPGGFGVGIIIGSTQQVVSASQTDATWVAASSTGNWAIFVVSGGTTITFQQINGATSAAVGSLTLNSPWTGMATTGSGARAILAGDGVYALQNPSPAGYGELGVKVR